MLVFPLARALAQLDDPVFLRVVLRGVLLAAALFVALAVGCAWSLASLAGQHGWLAWLAGALGGVGSLLVAAWLFVPVAVGMAALFTDQVARAVERRFYPDLPPARGAPLPEQIWDGVALGLQVLVLNLLGLVLALGSAGLGLGLGWLVAGWAIGRGLFVAVAMRRMSRGAARRLYARQPLAVIVPGVVLALAATVPLVNLLVPVLGTAVMVHVLMQIQNRRSAG
jgi:CysZ protein